MFTRLALVPLAALLLGCSDANDSAAVRTPPQAAAQTTARPSIATQPTRAAEPKPGLADWVRDARRGSLVLRVQDSGKLSAGPELGTEVDVEITGTIARAAVRQRFENPTEAWVEGIYVFPLPDDAAVDHMRIRTDGRVIEGRIQEKEEARRTYEAAKAEGRRAGLVEQERPNVFTTRIANVRPGSEVTVEIEYQQTVRLDDGEFSLRVPTIVAPRYLPGSVGGETSAPAPAGSIEITIDLAAGFDVEKIESPYHEVAIRNDGTSYEIRLAGGPVPADRDFVLTWTPIPGQEPEAVVYTETWEGDTYALMMLTPPFDESPAARAIPREVVYVVDTSGSMAGASMIQARTALAFALERLGPADSFNVIEFDNETRPLYPEARAATPANVEQALGTVSALRASGGTDIAPAIRLALQDPGTSRSALRQVVFLTDGVVGNEAQLLEEVKGKVGESRVFAVGIGPAPNSFFMRKLAQLGRGSFTHIGDPAEVDQKMTALFRKLESAVLADVEIELPPDVDVEMYPYRVPDLYVGEPISVVMKLDAPFGPTQVTAWTGDSPWQVTLDAWDAETRPGIHVLFARQAIEERMDDRLGTRDEQLLAALRAEAVEIAVDHHLVSAYTSLVAVDVTPERYPDEALAPHQLGAVLPPGFPADGDVGFAQGATPAGLQILAGLTMLAGGIAWRRLAR